MKTQNQYFMRGVLVRLESSENQTLGRLTIYDGLDPVFQCCTMEPPWRENKKNVSCIPTGEYRVNARNSEKHADHFHVRAVPDRDYILIHVANYHTQLRGCIGVGSDFYDINADGDFDITSSRRTLRKLVNLIPEGFNLIII